MNQTTWGGGRSSPSSMASVITSEINSESTSLFGSGYEALERSGGLRYIGSAADLKLMVGCEQSASVMDL